MVFFLTEMFGILFSFDIYGAVKSLKVKVKARTEFSIVWGEYKNHTNPYIQGTIVRTL